MLSEITNSPTGSKPWLDRSSPGLDCSAVLGDGHLRNAPGIADRIVSALAPSRGAAQ